MLKKTFAFLKAHKFWAGLIILALLGGSYWSYQKFSNDKETVRYVLAQVEKGTLINSVSGSGQISAANQVDLKAKASGKLLRLLVKSGDQVKSGAVIGYLDSSDALKSVRDAQANLTSAKLSLEKLNQPADQLSLLQAENSLTASRENKTQAQTDLEQAYESGFNAVSSAFLDLPTILAGLDNLLFSSSFEKNQQNLDWYVNQTSLTDRLKAELLRDEAFNAYGQTRELYAKNFDDYKAASRSSDKTAIEALINQTYETAKAFAETVKVANNFLDFVQDSMEQKKMTVPATMATHQANLNTYTGTANSQLTGLLNIKETITNAKQTIIEAGRSIEEKTQSLAKLKAGADSLDLKSQELSIQQRENALKDAQEKLADYTVRSPFAGLIAELPVKQGDDLASDATVATMISEQWLAEVSLNEIDAAKIKLGQKATLTFDALADLSLSGQVAEVDSLGTVAQGVVSYNIKIALDSEAPEQIKSGMSVSAAIITDIKNDVLLIPNEAVKSLNNRSYAELPQNLLTTEQLADSEIGLILPNGLKQQEIEIGLSNDSSTEVLSGLSEGEQIIVRTINPNNNQAAAGQSLFSSSASSRSSGGGNFNVRMLR